MITWAKNNGIVGYKHSGIVDVNRMILRAKNWEHFLPLLVDDLFGDYTHNISGIITIH